MSATFRYASILCLVAALINHSHLVHAAKTWNGNNSVFLGDGLNWAGGAPTHNNNANSDVIFSSTATSGPTLTIDYAPLIGAYRSTTFDATAPAYTFVDDAGNPSEYRFNFATNGNTTNNSTFTQTFNNGYLGLVRRGINAAAGDFVFNNASLNIGDGGVINSVNGINLDGARDIYVNKGFVGASGARLDKNGAGTVYLAESPVNAILNTGVSPNSRWGGQLSIAVGKVQINNSFSLGETGDINTPSDSWTEIRGTGALVLSDRAPTTTGGPVNVAGNITTGELFYAAARTTTAAQIINSTGTNTLSGTVVGLGDPINNTVALQSDGTGVGDQFVVSGQIQQVNSATTLTLSLQGAGNGLVSGTITQPATTNVFGIGALADNVWNVTKNDAGTWTLSGNNAYTGTTTVSGGKLLVNGTHTGGGLYTVDSGAILGGNSTNLAANVTVNGTLAPGNSIDTFTINGNVDLNGALAVEYNSTLNTIDLLNVTGSLDITGATFNFTDVQPGSLSLSPHVFVTYGSLAGNPATEVGVPLGFKVNYTYGGNQIALIPVPEPATLALLGSLLPAGLMVARRRRPGQTL